MIRCWLGIHRWSCERFSDWHNSVLTRHCVRCGRQKLKASVALPHSSVNEWFTNRHHRYYEGDPFLEQFYEVRRHPLRAFYHRLSSRLSKLRNHLICRG